MDYTGKNNSIPKVKSPFTTVEIKIIHDDGLVFLDILDHKNQVRTRKIYEHIILLIRKIHHLGKPHKNNLGLHFESSDEKSTESDVLYD